MCVVCHALGRGLCVLWAESRRVKGLPKRQAQWAARVLRLELFICFTLGLTTFIATRFRKEVDGFVIEKVTFEAFLWVGCHGVALFRPRSGPPSTW